MPRREKLNEDYLVKRVIDTGGYARKVVWSGVRGAPDRLCAWPQHHRHAYVEVKEEGQPWGLQDHQKREHERMRAAGMPVWVVYNKHEIDLFINCQINQK